MLKVKRIAKVYFQDYLGRAEEFFHGMKNEEVFEKYNASALLGIHASIALADALAIFALGKRAADEQHRDTVKLLNKICNDRHLKTDGAKRLGKILSQKNNIAYGERYSTVDTDNMKKARVDVLRFFSWVFKNFADLKRAIRTDMQV